MNNYAQELLFVILALLFVVVMAWLLLKGLRGFHSQSADGARIKLILTLAIGTKERLAVVNYRDHEYLIGITPSSITLLDKSPASQETTHTSNSDSES
ncbi:MAG: flagellar biosynthetic protein FliO [Chromatiales bacterium]|jgi:flagellar protein FliO/FliZ